MPKWKRSSVSYSVTENYNPMVKYWIIYGQDPNHDFSSSKLSMECGRFTTNRCTVRPTTSVVVSTTRNLWQSDGVRVALTIGSDA